MKIPVHYPSLSPKQRRVFREHYVKLQKGVCLFCKAPLDGPPSKEIQDARIEPKLFPPGFFSHPVHLHHNHRTGMTECAVHARCNAYLFEHLGR